MKYLINKDNYEQYAMDFVEGQLSGELLMSFERFLKQYPEVRDELEELSDSILVPETSSVSGFDPEALKKRVVKVKSIDESNYEDFLIGDVEDLLSKPDQHTLVAFLDANPSLKLDQELYRKTRLKADVSIEYAAGNLKQPVPLSEYTQSIVFRVAAGLAILLGITSVLLQLNEQVYERRSSAGDFAAMENLPVFEAPADVVADASRETEVEASEERVLELPALRRDLMAALDPIERRGLSDQNTSNTGIMLKEETSFIASINPWTELQVIEPDEELTFAQYLGREVLGKDPSITAREFLSEEVRKVTDNSGIVKSSNDPSKRTFQLLAGAFEFKRVSYKNQ